MMLRKAVFMKSRGFTMIELMITTVIIGVLAALSAPSLQRAYEKSSFKGGERLLTSALKLARSYAISNKDLFGVYINAENRELIVFQNSVDPSTPSYSEGDSVYWVDTLPSEFDYIYVSMANSAVVFRPNGSAVGTGYETIYLVGESDNMLAYFAISVLAATGRVGTNSHFYDW
jgi:prepilin-type N-terminal cleavage/methylation domain-containing protein